MTDQELKYCFEKYGSPIYVFDTQELKTRVKDIAGIWGDKVKLCYSIKANPFLMKDMLEVVDKLEVCSPGELEICKNLNVQGEHIIFYVCRPVNSNLPTLVYGKNRIIC